MSKAKILLQLDSDPQPSSFDSVVAIDAGADQLLRYGGVRPEQVESLVHGAIFTRGIDDLRSTAIFVGGSNVAAGVELLEAVKKTFFGPMRVSVLFDANGANTTAAAAVLAAAKHVSLDGARALVLAGTGPVGQRAARLLARQGAQVRIASRDRARSQKVADELQARIGGARFDAVQTSTADETAKALEDVQIVIAAGAAGVELLSESSRQQASALQVAIDLNAVPPLGIGGLKVTDKAESRDGVICYGAIGVGGTKMKIHKAALRRLFEANDQVLYAEEVYAIGEERS
ncbi:MAG: bifunctional NADP-dependent methylenetetrahydromethanopterin dehydrogenase/methylenetetrahydrofolate dehydrogenase [Planctomycetales bacterium]|nr:bifunctional NADP-dependent methylenetetrahydromethanopterin dehydrogenase/methylenetetrahydrofolate dehydrogenase [Planctomycetales bacterium]